MKPSEQKIYGRNACLAFARKFPDSVIRAYCTESTQGSLSFLLKKLAQLRRAYHIVTATDLNKLSESEHHEGFLLLVERPALKSENEILTSLSQLPANKPECILCLDGISNPHNLGSIVRTSAHFGIKKIILFETDLQNIKSLTSGSYHRTAEGGAVHVDLCVAENPKVFLETLSVKHGFTIAATSSHTKSSLLNRTVLPGRLALVMGSEALGVRPEIMGMASLKLAINGTGHVESLNVASATAILLNEYCRQEERQRVKPSRGSSKPTLVGRESGRKRMGS